MFNYKVSEVRRMVLAGLLLALTIIFTRFLSIQYIPGIPFTRISLGPCMIIFASLLLGPIYGGAVGGLSDLFGILMVPNAQGYSINPLITVCYTLLGIVPWLVYKLVLKIKSERVEYIALISVLFAFTIFVTIVTLTIYQDLKLWVKLVIIIGSSVISVASVFLVPLINRFFKKKDSTIKVYKIGFTSAIVEFVVLFLLNSFAKAYYFQTDVLFIMFCQGVAFFINILLDTFLISYLIFILKRMSHIDDGEINEKE